MLGGGQVHVNRMFEVIGQLGQLEVVGGEQGVTPDVLCQVLGRGPGQRKAIEGAGAAAHFIHQHQAVFGGIVQDIGGFGHFHHEGGAATGYVIRGAHASEDPVHRAKHGAVGGHETAGVGQQGNQGGLAHVGGLTAHVRAGDHQHAAFGIHQQVVGHKRLVEQLLHHRVPTFLHIKSWLVGKFRRGEAQGRGSFGEVAQHVEFGQGLGGVLQRGQLFGHGFQDVVVQAFFPGQGTAFGAQCLVLKLFQFRGDEAFGVFQGLAADIVHRRLVRLRPADFDVVTMHPVVAHFQGGNAGAFTLPGFHIQQILAGVFTDVAEFIQFFVEAFGNHTAITNYHRRVVDDGAFQQVGQFRVFTDDGGQLHDMV